MNQPHQQKQKRVAQHYNSDSIFDYESVRLSQYATIEFKITTRYLSRLIPSRAIVADIGVGVGHYAEIVAKQGCSLYLVDISQRLLQSAYTRLKEQNLHQHIIKMYNASSTDLSCLQTESVDVVLLLGPLYHLCSFEERQGTIKEAVRLLKQNGLLFAAGINRLAYFREQFRNNPKDVLSRHNFHQQFLQNGNTDPLHLPPLGYAHLTTCEEFRQLFASDFEQITLTGIESFTSPFPDTANSLSPEELEGWLGLVEATGNTPEGLGMTDHFLYIGRRK